MRGAPDRARLVVGLGHDCLGLTASPFPDIARGLLGGDQRLREQVLATAELRDLLLERLDLVGQLAALAPRRLEALGDLLDQLLDGGAVVTEEASSDLHVPQFDWCVRHTSPSG
jgi:hypothetical protein